jgi:hypothetical protein
MGAQKQQKNYRASWSTIFFSAIALVAGPLYISNSITAYNLNTLVPPTSRHGWLTWQQALVIGILTTLIALTLLIYEGYKTYKRRQPDP